MQAQTVSGGITHTLLTSAVDGGEWPTSRPHRKLNPHHFVVERNSLNPSVLRCLYLSCGHRRTSSAAFIYRVAIAGPVVLPRLNAQRP